MLALCGSIGVSAAGQTKVGTYPCAYLDKEYAVSYGKRGDFWIECASFEKGGGRSGIQVDAKRLAQFKTGLMAMKTKFTEWDSTAKANNVEKVSKEMPVDMPKVDCYFGNANIYFAFGQPLTVKFGYDDTGSEVVMFTRKLTSSTNQYIKNDGLLFAFKTPEEIQALHDLLDPDRAQDVLKEKQNTEDIFK